MTKKTAIVTGGSQGLGRALSAELVGRGWTVIVDGRDKTDLDAAAAMTGAVAVPGDIADPGHRHDLIETAERLTGRLDLVMNNAGSLGTTPLPHLGSYPLEDLRALLDTNVVAALGLIQDALPSLHRDGGVVVNVTSDAAVEAYEGWGGYGASKAALEQLSRVLAAEEPGVTVWWVDPGDMRTRMHQDAFPGEDISDRPDPGTVAPSLADLIERRPPSGRVRVADLLTGSLT